MHIFVRAIALLSCVIAGLSSPATAQSILPQMRNPAGSYVPSQGNLDIDANGYALLGPAPSTPLAGMASASGAVGPFAPQLGRAIWITLAGTWAGTVQVTRTIDSLCADAVPLTAAGTAWASFSANANEPIGFETAASAKYCLSITMTSGSVSYRLTQ